MAILHQPRLAKANVSNQKGVGIVEALVALVVISFGVLGIAGLQLAGMKHSSSGLARAKAVMVADDLSTRMRMNRTGSKAGDYDGFDTDSFACAAAPTAFCQTTSSEVAQSCNAIQIATFDKYSLACGLSDGAARQGGIDELLPPNSRLSVVCDDSPCEEDSSYTITVRWLEVENASSSSDSTRSLTVKMRP